MRKFGALVALIAATFSSPAMAQLPVVNPFERLFYTLKYEVGLGGIDDTFFVVIVAVVLLLGAFVAGKIMSWARHQDDVVKYEREIRARQEAERRVNRRR